MALRSRAEFLRQTLGDPWPDVTERRCAGSIACAYLGGHTSFHIVTPNDLDGLLAELLP